MGSEETTTQRLAAEFALEVKQRQQGRLLLGMKWGAIAFAILLVGAAFIPDPGLRRSLGLGVLMLLLSLKGYASYLQWKMRRR